MLRQGVGGEERRRWTPLECLQCPLLVVKVIKYWFGEMSKYSPHISRSKNTVCPLTGPIPVGPAAAMVPLFVFSFISQIIHHKAPAFHCQWLSSCFNAHIFASRFIFRLP